MIYVDGKKGIFHIATGRISYVMSLYKERYLIHRYYGKRLRPDTDVSDGLLTSLPDVYLPWEEGDADIDSSAEKANLTDYLHMEYPVTGTGDTGLCALSVSNYQGQTGAELIYDTYRISEKKPPLTQDDSILPATFGDNAHTLDIDLRDEILGLKVTLSYTVFDDSDALIKSVRFVNEGDKNITLNKAYSSYLTLPQGDYDRISLAGTWTRERHIDREHIGCGIYSTGSKRGVSSAEYAPFIMALSHNATKDYGDVYAMNLVYSGDHIEMIERDRMDEHGMVIGIHPEYFSWDLSPGGHFQTPEAVCVYSPDGIDDMTHTFHDLYRSHLIPPKWVYRPRPILINNWEATYFDFDEEKILDIARDAKSCDIEMLVMDDGWFLNRDDDTSGLGDWEVDKEKLPHGLKGLSERIHAMGMKFGIWIEPEMVSKDSDLYTKHPDMVFHLDGREPALRRSQLVLDITRADVRDLIFDKIEAAFSDADIDYIKWDMNRHLSDVGNADAQQGKLRHRYVLALYEMQKRLISDMPDILLENCSSGGARYDPAMLYFSPQIWCSDDTDAIERLSIQEGTALIYPLSTMGAHVSACPNHITGRVVPFKTRGVTALSGAFGYELDITELSESERSQIESQIDARKRYEDLFLSGDYYRLCSISIDGADAYMVVSKDKKIALVSYTQVMVKPYTAPYVLKLRGLDPFISYHVRAGYGYDKEDIKERDVTGDVLMYAGLCMPCREGDYQSGWIEISGT